MIATRSPGGDVVELRPSGAPRDGSRTASLPLDEQLAIATVKVTGDCGRWLSRIAASRGAVRVRACSATAAAPVQKPTPTRIAKKGVELPPVADDGKRRRFARASFVNCDSPVATDPR